MEEVAVDAPVGQRVETRTNREISILVCRLLRAVPQGLAIVHHGRFVMRGYASATTQLLKAAARNDDHGGGRQRPLSLAALSSTVALCSALYGPGVCNRPRKNCVPTGVLERLNAGRGPLPGFRVSRRETDTR